MDFSEERGSLIIHSDQLRLHFDSDFYCRTESFTSSKWKSLGISKPSPGLRRPFHYLFLDDIPIDKFNLRVEATRCERTNTEFGNGKRFYLHGSDEESLDSPVALELEIDILERFPLTAVVRSRFDFEEPIPPNTPFEIVSNNQLLDARQAGGDSPIDMWVFNGSAELREHCLQALTPDYYKRNYLGVLESPDGGGHQPKYRHGSQPGFGGGTPVVAIWGREVGVSVGHLERVFKRCSIPVRANKSQSISFGLVGHYRGVGDQEKTIRSFDTFLHCHKGDFFNALNNYRELMACRDITFSTPATAAYEPQWDSWGFRENFRPEEVLDAVPHLKEMGIYWITLDDRWFDATGDWLPRRDRFPGGEEQFCEFIDNLHQQGMKVKLWTIPAEVDGDPDTDQWLKQHPSAITEVRKHSQHSTARFYEQNPDWIVVGPNGEGELSKRGNNFCCGSLTGVREHFRQITERMFRNWRIDGLKQDAVYLCPACYAEDHYHSDPDEASRDYSVILKVVFETALKYNPDAVIVNCPCGTTLTPDWMCWQNQALSPDPWTSWINRGIVKQLKALFGPAAAVVLDHIELSDEGQDFSLIGVGGVPATRITPTSQEKTFGSACLLTFEQRKEKWKRWIGLYRELMLSQGEYLNLYDLIFDKPETHVIRKGNKLYYGFYPGEPDGIVADQRDLYKKKKDTKYFQGTLEFRGLERGKRYQAYDYENQKVLGTLEGNTPFLDIEIFHHLLVEVSEIDSCLRLISA